jgi:hypothetical protein
MMEYTITRGENSVTIINYWLKLITIIGNAG